jgi:hypothetical protein
MIRFESPASRREAALLTLLPTFVLLASCGTDLSRGRTVLSVAGQTLVAVEREFAPRYEAAGEHARATASTYDAYGESMRRWFAAATAIELTATSLRVAETSLDAIEHGTTGDVRAVLACVAERLVDVLDALSGLIEIPPALVTTIRAVRELTGGACVPTEGIEARLP